MKQTRMTEYRPNYPKKLLKSAVLTAATLLAVGSAAGCRTAQGEPLVLDGDVMIADPTDEPLVLEGEVAVDEPTPEPVEEPTPDPDEEPEWMGDVIADPSEP